MPNTGNAKDCHTHKCSYFYIKNVTWRTYLISFTVECCFLFRLVSIELVSLIWVLQIWVAIYVFGTIIFNKEIHANVYCHSLWEYFKRFHCSFEWHLTPHMTLSIETVPVLGRHPVLSGHYSIPWGCPLNTGFTVFWIMRTLKWKLNRQILWQI